MADAGQLVCVFAGLGPTVKRVIPYEKAVMGHANIDYRDQPHRNTTLLKFTGSTFIFNMVETLSECHTVAEKSSSGSDNLHPVIETFLFRTLRSVLGVVDEW